MSSPVDRPPGLELFRAQHSQVTMPVPFTGDGLGYINPHDMMFHHRTHFNPDAFFKMHAYIPNSVVPPGFQRKMGVKSLEELEKELLSKSQVQDDSQPDIISTHVTHVVTPSPNRRESNSKQKSETVSVTHDNTNAQSDENTLGSPQKKNPTKQKRPEVPSSPQKKVEVSHNAKLTPEQAELLTKEIENLVKNIEPDQKELDSRLKLFSKLDDMIKVTFRDNAPSLHVYGSSGNGLSSKKGDIDICLKLKFDDNIPDAEFVVSKLGDQLKKGGMKDVLPLPFARCPIVKCTDPEMNIACDICVNNDLALRNTKLLGTYMSIDERARKLALFIKYWAKKRKISDTYEGVLSINSSCYFHFFLLKKNSSNNNVLVMYLQDF
eukprot:TRINITY_DN2390_c0_g1_i2.p1 TRINITY_DN2390_c0_g1~~TRINITY_DN2390_c0_g1_i2.p1  ORF type:complete len:379 (+),score=60.65 TRINITY_DN2390_c0_g1_i2:2-1138(+)